MTTGAEPIKSLNKKKKQFSLVPQLDQYPWLVKFVQTHIGKAVLLGVFSGFLCLFWPKWVVFIGTCLFFCIFLPNERHIILVVGSLASICFGRTYLQWDVVVDVLAPSYGISGDLLTFPGAVLAVGIVFFCCFLLIHFSKASRTGFRIRRPVLLVISCYLIVACLLSYIPVHSFIKFGLWVFMLIFSKYIWYLCYSLVEANVPGSPSFAEQLGLYIPFWYVSVLPYHRGGNNLRRIKATTPAELAKCQLKGLKLLIWAAYLILASFCYNTVCYGYAFDLTGMISTYIERANGPLNFYFQNELFYTIDSWPVFLNLPTYDYAFEQCAAGRPLYFYWNWLVLIGRFFTDLLNLAFISHAGIAICRMAGYDALRNVYRPLQSKTIAEFWNRYFFYYKELMVNVFFYPTFFRYFKDRPVLRLYMATFAAAGFGNFFYHFLLKFELLRAEGIWATVVSMQSLALYVFLLVNGIFVSQWRRIKAGPNRKMLPQPLPAILVLGFYCVINVFTNIRGMSIAENFKFFLALFNFGTS